jgi:hypothetical protein
MLTIRIRSRLWLYPGKGGWHFITLPEGRAKEIRASLRQMRRGWGSIPVKATIGRTSWRTSMFPDKKSSSYLLPVKSDVRTKEAIEAGDSVGVMIEIMI